MKYTVLVSGLDIFTHALNMYLQMYKYVFVQIASILIYKKIRCSDQTALTLITLHEPLCDVDLCSSLCLRLCRLLKYGVSSCMCDEDCGDQKPELVSTSVAADGPQGVSLKKMGTLW